MASKPDRKNAARRRTPTKVESPREVVAAASEKPLDIDVEKHLEWLETGKGSPWPARRS